VCQSLENVGSKTSELRRKLISRKETLNGRRLSVHIERATVTSRVARQWVVCMRSKLRFNGNHYNTDRRAVGCTCEKTVKAAEFCAGLILIVRSHGVNVHH